MKIRYSLLVVSAVVVGVVALPPVAEPQQPAVARKTVFATLKVDQAVTLKEKGQLFEITTMDLDTPLTHTVVEVADDFVALRDASELIESRIPVTAIRSVSHVKLNRK